MVRPKPPPKKKLQPKKKQQTRGTDFKKIKHKIGKKLPKSTNTTNTEIKSKAIILPEQSVASEKAGLAVSTKKGLTLKELLQQTSHHNPKVRKDSLMGIRDVVLKHPDELRLHKNAVIEKLRERIGDDDKMVRETLYQLLSVIFPRFEEDSQGPLISLVMAYIFNAMTHLSIEVRLMAFKFFDLVVHHYPSSFLLYAEKVLQNYEDILRENNFYLQDKEKLKSALAGLVRCLSLLPCDNREVGSCGKDIAERGVLHAFESNVPKDPAGFANMFKKLKNLVPVLVNCFNEFISLVRSMEEFDAQSFDCMLCILQSIDLALRFSLHWTDKYHTDLQVSIPHKKEPDVGRYDQTLWRLFDLFPLIPMHHHPSAKDNDRYFILNIVMTEIFLRFSDWFCPSAVLLDKFLEFTKRALFSLIKEKKTKRALSGENEQETMAQEKDNSSGTRSGKAFREKHVLSLLPFIPKLVSKVAGNWKSCLLQAFTNAFKDCCTDLPKENKKKDTSLILACLSTVEEMLIPSHGMPYLDASDPDMVEHQIIWISELPSLLILLGDKHPSVSQVVLHLLLVLGQHAMLNSSLAQGDNNILGSLKKFYSTCLDGKICYGPFIRLPRESQELSICCLYYISGLDSTVLESLASCCLCPKLEPYLLFRIIEVLHSAFIAGHIGIMDHISFFVTLLARFRVFPGNIDHDMDKDFKIRRGILKSLTSIICSCLSQMGDCSLVFQMLEKLIVDELSQKPPLDNICALLRMLIKLDSRPSRLSEESIINLSKILAEYLIDVVHTIQENNDDDVKRTHQYYYLPCFFLFDKSHTMLKRVWNKFGLLITENSSSNVSHHASAIVSSLIVMHRDPKIRRIMSSCKADIDHVLEMINYLLQPSEDNNMTMEERRKIHLVVDCLNIVRNAFHDGRLKI